MSEHEQSHEEPKDPAQETAQQVRETADGYVAHVMEVLTQPDAFFAAGHRSGRTNAMIDLGGFLLVFFITTVVARTFGYSGFDFEFGHLGDGLKAVLTIGIPIAALLFALSWQGGRSGGQASLDFYIEKFGAALVLPTLLLIVATLLDVIDVRIQSWFSGLAVVLVYVAAFATSYAYAAPGRLKTAVIFTAGFFVAFRLLTQLF